jgi:predicted nucleotidyltransferase
MGTSLANPIGSVLFAKNRRAILGLLFRRPTESFYVREIARACGSGMGAIQRELAQLTAAGILQRRVRGHQVHYQANAACPVFEELKRLVIKTAGVADVLQGALAPLADRITVAFVFGSMARADAGPESDVDVAIIGKVSFTQVVDALAAAQENLGREVNPVVYGPGEWRSKLAKGHHFVERLLEEEKIFLIGGESELAGLATKRLAGGADG